MHYVVRGTWKLRRKRERSYATWMKAKKRWEDKAMSTQPGGPTKTGFGSVTSVPKGFEQMYQELLNDPELMNNKRLAARDETWLAAFVRDKESLTNQEMKILLMFEQTIRQHITAEVAAKAESIERKHDAARAAIIANIVKKTFSHCNHCLQPLDRLVEIFIVGLSYAMQLVNVEELAEMVRPILDELAPNGVVDMEKRLAANMELLNRDTGIRPST